MRLWTLHPCYLDRQGLLAAWREALLAQKVLLGETRGYRHHPQLARFRAHTDPVRAVGRYLAAVAGEAAARGYAFDHSKIASPGECQPIVCTSGQLEYEWGHLKAKLSRRDPARLESIANVAIPIPHPLFVIAPGPVEPWEVIAG